LWLARVWTRRGRGRRGVNRNLCVRSERRQQKYGKQAEGGKAQETALSERARSIRSWRTR
jgi:hypothetical protein